MTKASRERAVAARALKLGGHYSPDYLACYGVLPTALHDGVLNVLATGVPSAEVVADFARTFDARVEIENTSRDELEDSIQALFAAQTSMSSLIEGLDSPSVEGNGHDALADTSDVVNQAPVVRFVNLLFRDALAARASDVHIEAYETGVRIRVRVDGVLAALPEPPKALHQPIVSRLKLLADLDISKTRVPQDGRIRLRTTAGEIDVRVSTVPTLFGESVVMRLLANDTKPRRLEELGMPPEIAEPFQRLIASPNGLLLATGPTGSGKTTTLHSGLASRASVREKLVSVEDPVEYVVDGVTQVPVISTAGITFANALRSILRQDPDVVMVGEMRDEETATIAVQAALTGHLVLSTLHTNDAVSAIARLRDLGVRSYLLAATLTGILAQRLVRRRCPHCEIALDADCSSARSLQACDTCRSTGYLGRVGLYQLLIVNDALREAIAEGASEAQLLQIARGQGMRLMSDDGAQKVERGETTYAEIRRVLGEKGVA